MNWKEECQKSEEEHQILSDLFAKGIASGIAIACLCKKKE